MGWEWCEGLRLFLRKRVGKIGGADGEISGGRAALTRAVSRRLERLEKRAETIARAETQPPRTIRFVDVNHRVTSKLELKDGGAVWTHFDRERAAEIPGPETPRLRRRQRAQERLLASEKTPTDIS